MDPPVHVVRREVLDNAESIRGYKAFEDDPYGVGAFLDRKRKERGWDARRIMQIWKADMGDEVLSLLRWSGGECGKAKFPERLPWE